jgi:hypothetical protein
MKLLLDTIETNFDLYDLLSYNYSNTVNKNESDNCDSEIILDKSILKAYRDKIAWDKISSGARLTEDLIDEFFEELKRYSTINDFGSTNKFLFSTNTNIVWSDSLLEKYKKNGGDYLISYICLSSVA